jgi:hypothetical protein
MQPHRSARWLVAGLAVLLSFAQAADGASAQQRDKITIVMFGAPSLGAPSCHR